MRFRVAPESTRAAIVEDEPISETDKQRREDEKRDIEVRIQAVRKQLTSSLLGTGSFPTEVIARRQQMEPDNGRLLPWTRSSAS